MRLTSLSIPILAAALTALPVSVRSDGPFALGLTLKDHLFDPSEAPTGRDIAITLKSEDDSFEEFDSDFLHTEKIVTAKGKVTIKLKPLAAGRLSVPGRVS